MPIHSNIPQCQYIKTDGCRCGSPALKTKRWCYFHYEVNRKTVTLDVPPLEDGNAVQLALTDLARAVADDRIQLKNAALLAYILQTASANLKRVQLGVFTDNMVRDLPELDPYSRGPAREEASSAPSAMSASAPSAVQASDPSVEHDFNRAETTGAPAPTTLPEAHAQRQRSANPSAPPQSDVIMSEAASASEGPGRPPAQVRQGRTHSAASAVNGSDPRPSASIRGRQSSAPSAVKGLGPLPQKIAAAKSGSLKDARELLDLLDAVS